jgi:hypothetical protein
MNNQNKVYLVTLYVPQSRQSGRFRTIGIVARDDAAAATTATSALQHELRDPTLLNLMEIVTITRMPERTVVYDVSGNAFVVTVLLAPVGGNIAA